jgi:hypothetical protein
VDSVFSCKKNGQGHFYEQKIFFLEKGHYGLLKNLEFYADFRSEYIILKNVPKKVRPKKTFFFFWGTDLGGFLGKQLFWDYLSFGAFFSE